MTIVQNPYRHRDHQRRSEGKKLHQTERMWVVGKNEFYHKETGRRHFAENTRRRLLLETIEAIGGSHD
ncbi:hypothetical protein LNP74_23040 [Klebsiella pneumoniae subsp. pneumoniae]|nr:hypothetical protein [Klebsiella pneumoniae subsp. pneumoniae]